MHRSGTSALARAVQTLGVYLGNNFLSSRPDNPTGYWEDKHICDLNERLLAAFGFKWEDVGLIDDGQWDEPSLKPLLTEAVDYLRTEFLAHPLWGFKDPRTLRLLPFWQLALRRLDVKERYLLVIRNPRSVALSLLERQGMDEVTAHLLWLVYMIPYLKEIAHRPFIVSDYDLVLDDPGPQIERIARGLKIPLDESLRAGIAEFAEDFLDPDLRHSFFRHSDFDTNPTLGPLTRETYLWLRRMAEDRLAGDSSSFWTAWESSRQSLQRLVARTSERLS